MKILLLASVLSMSLTALADSKLKVVNDSSVPVYAIWQGGGCIAVAEDPEGDDQYTVCLNLEIAPGAKNYFRFDMLQIDRSVKVWKSSGGERIGYCNSLDNETLTITGTHPDNLKVTGC